MSSFSDKLYRTKVAPLLVIGFLYCSCFLPSVFADGASTLSDEGPNHSGNLRASRGLQTAGLVSESESDDEKGLKDLLKDLAKVYDEQNMESDLVSETNYAAVEKKDLSESESDDEKGLKDLLKDLAKVYDEQNMESDLVSETNYAAVEKKDLSVKGAAEQKEGGSVAEKNYGVVEALEETLENMGEEYDEDLEDLIPEVNHAKVETFEDNLKEMGEAYEEDLEDLVPERNYAAVQTLKEDLEDMGVVAENELEDLVPKTNYAAEETLEEDFEDLAEKYEKELEDLVPETNYAQSEAPSGKKREELADSEEEYLVAETNQAAAQTYCGCDSCDDSVFDTYAGDYKCGARINYLKTARGMDERSACAQIGGEEHPDECGDCDPETCTSTTTSDNNDVSNNYCGCESCTGNVWNTNAGGHSCGDRIDYLQSPQGGSLSSRDACSQIGGEEFQNQCGGCDPESCNGSSPSANESTPSVNESTPDENNGGSVKVMSYNTQYTGYFDGRIPAFAAKIREQAADVVGVQECQIPDPLASQSGYGLVPNTGNQNYILYNQNSLDLLGSGYMPIPRDEHSERAITWGHFRMKDTGSDFWFFNTHLPHNSREASSRNTHARIGNMLLRKREELGAGNAPTVVVGDCNPFASTGAPEGTFETSLRAGGIPLVYIATGETGGHVRLDKIFASEANWNWSGGADVGTGRSDHPAIVATLTLKD